MHERLLVLTAGALVAGVLACASVEPATSAENIRAGKPPSSEAADLQARVAASFAQTGRQHLKTGRLKEAIEDFTAALSFDPALSTAREGLAQAQARLDHAAEQSQPPPRPAKPPDDAIIRAQAALKGMPEPDAAEEKHPPAKSRTGPAEENRAALDQEYEAAVEEAIRQVGRMMRPQTKIMDRGDLPTAMDKLRRHKDYTTDTISAGRLQSPADRDAIRLIEAKLLKKLNINFKNKPFVEVVEYLRAAADINIIVDDAVIPATHPVTLVCANMELRNFLYWLLRAQDLDYRMRRGAIFISNEDGLAERRVTVLHDIADLTLKIRNFKPLAAGSSLVNSSNRNRSIMSAEAKKDKQPLDPAREGAEWATFIRENVAPSTWSAEGGVAQNTIRYRNGKLVVRQTPEVQEQIRELLDSFRRARAIQVAILARFITISQDTLEEIGVQWRGDNPEETIASWINPATGEVYVDDDGDPVNPITGSMEWADPSPGIIDTAGTGTIEMSSSPTHEVSLPTGSFTQADPMKVVFNFLKTWEVRAILTAVRKERTGNILTAPRVTCFNTQRAFLSQTTRSNYVEEYEVQGDDVAVPVINQVDEGIVLEVQPFVSADRRYITLELIPQVREVLGFQEFSREGGTGTLATMVWQLPRVSTREVRTTVSVPDGGTLLIGGLAQGTENKGHSTVPILGDIPLLKYLFTSRRQVDSRRHLIILVTAHIIQQRED